MKICKPMCFEGKMGRNVGRFRNQERIHDHTNVETLRDVSKDIFTLRRLCTKQKEIYSFLL